MIELVVLAISTFLTVFGVYHWQKGRYLLTNGKRAHAIVFKNNTSSDSDNLTVYYPVVRFLTEKQEWITQELGMIGTSTPMREGRKVIVIYDPDEPTNVEIFSSFRLRTLPLLLAVLGGCGLVFIALEIFNVTQFMGN